MKEFSKILMFFLIFFTIFYSNLRQSWKQSVPLSMAVPLLAKKIKPEFMYFKLLSNSHEQLCRILNKEGAESSQ